MHTIDISKCPKNESIFICDPNGTILTETNDEVVLTYVRKEVAENALEGYYVVYKGKKYDINHYGGIDNWPIDMMSATEKLCVSIIEAAMKQKAKEEGIEDTDE